MPSNPELTAPECITARQALDALSQQSHDDRGDGEARHE
jgi:hypothetical protein